MVPSLRSGLIALALAAAVGGGAWTARARAQAKETHPVVADAILQLEAIKEDLQKAPANYGGHKAAAIKAISQAMDELQQAIAYQKK